MSEDRKYVRVYYNDLIRDYPEVWADDALLATWLRMLATADPMWPTPPELPRSVRSRPLAGLTTASLVAVLPAHRFRMKGMDAERTRRQDAARNAAASRWQSDRTAESNAEAMPKRAKQSKDEQRLNRADARADEPHVEAWLMVKHRLPTPRQQAFLDRYLQVFDETGPQRMAALILRHSDDPIAALKADLDAFREERLGELANGQPASKPKPRAKREPWQEQFRELMAAKEADILASAPIPADDS